MTKVHNWHLKREMQYPYKESRPQRQFGAVFDINRCIGCQTCTMACRSTWTFGNGQEYMWWNNVETKPYGGYPQQWDVRLLSKLGQQKWDKDRYAGKTIFEKADGKGREEPLGYLPEKPQWRFPNIYEDTASGTSSKGLSLPIFDKFFFYVQRICNHCTHPACLAACPRKAIYKRPEDGIVLVDQKRCRGYQECVRACPYKKTLFNSETNKAEKCIACYPRVEKDEIPRCMAACVGSIRLSGWVSPPDKVRRDNPLDYLVHVRKVALPLYPQAIKTRTDPDSELFAVLKLFGTTTRTIERFTVQDEVVKGFGQDGTMVISIPIKEPFYERPFYDAAADAYRFNEP